MRPDSASSMVASLLLLLLLLLCLITTAAAQQETGGADWTNRFCKIHSTMLNEVDPEKCDTNTCAAALRGPVIATSPANINRLQSGELALDRACTTW